MRPGTIKHIVLLTIIFLALFLIIFNDTGTSKVPHNDYARFKLKPEEMSAVELMDYFSWSNSSSCKLAHDFGGAMMANPSGLDGQKAVCIQPPASHWSSSTICCAGKHFFKGTVSREIVPTTFG